mgnify:CR=1 FL=1
MKVLPFNLNTAKSGQAKGEKLEFLSPGAHKCKITGLKTSDELDDYNGSPFIEFAVTSNGKFGKCRFWAVKETDKPSTQEWKTKQMKDFLVNSGIRDFSDDSKAMNDALGKSLMIAFISDEYIGINRDTKEPTIRTALKYRWSAKLGGKCTYNQSMNQELSDEDMKDFQSRHKEWSNANSIEAENKSEEDLPF